MKTKIFKVSFIGRLNTAIGKVYKINEKIEMPANSSEEEIKLKLYDKYELIGRFKILNK